MSSFPGNKKKSARSNSEVSSDDASSPPSSVHMSVNTIANNNNNAPKYGTLVPNRVFVGGISSTTTESELSQLFSKYGNVKATKIIADRAGVSKGYGFVTFETEEEAKRLQLDADNIVLRERRLNIAPAIKKQPFNRSFESATSPPPVAATNVFYHNGVPYTFHNGVAYFPQTSAQAAPIQPPPDASAVYQGNSYGPAQNASQPYSPAMMYPCPNPPPMFLSPQQYHPYPTVPVPSQAPQLVYTGGPNPPTANQTGNSAGENAAQSVQVAGPPAPYFLPPAMAQTTPEMYYNMPPTPSQGCYGPVVALASHDGVVHYCDVPLEQASNVSTEAGTTPSPASDEIHPNDGTVMSNEPSPVGEICKTVVQFEAQEHVFDETRLRENREEETPVVSLLSVQEQEVTVSSSSVNSRNPRRANGNFQQSLRYNSRYTSSSRFNSRREPIWQENDMVATFRQERIMVHHYNRGGSTNGRGFGGRGRGVKYVNNNNPNTVNNNYMESKSDQRTGNCTRGRGSIRGRSASLHGREGVRRGTMNGYRNNHHSSQPPSNHSAPPFRFQNGTKPNHHQHHQPQPHPYYSSNPNLPSYSPPLQVQQQFYQQRGMQSSYYHHYPIQHPMPPPPPPPPTRRYGNGGKKSNGTNNQHMGGGQRKMKTVEGMDSGAAGDGPVPTLMTHQMTLTPPTSPGANSMKTATATATSTEELCTHVQAMSL